MPDVLKSVLDKLEDVDEKYRGAYVQKGSKFELQVDGMKTPGDVERVTQSLNRERAAHDDTKKKLNDAKQSLEAFGELDPDDVKDKLEKLNTIEQSGGNPDATKIQSLIETGVSNRIKSETQKMQRSIDSLTRENATLKQQAESLGGQITQRQIDDQVRAEAVKLKVLDGAVPDALIHARGVFKLVDGRVQTDDGVEPAQWLEERKKTSPHWWPSARGAGAHGSGDGGLDGANPFTHDGWNVTEQSKLVSSDPIKANKLAAAAHPGGKPGMLRPPAPSR